VDHESRQQHKIDFGEDYLPMRFGDSQECKEQVLQYSAGSRQWLSLFCCAKERHHGGILAYREMTNEGPTAIISVAY